MSRALCNLDYLSKTKSKKKPYPENRHVSEAQGRASKYGMGGQEK